MRKMALMFSLVLLLSSVNVFSQDQAPAPSFKEGDFWRFKVTEDVKDLSSTKELDGIYELIHSQATVKAFELIGDKKVEVNLDPDDRSGTFLVLLGLHPKRLHLKFPLLVGQKWNYNYSFRPTGIRGFVQTRTTEVRVVGIEQITVPAGTFDTFKIITETISSRGPFASGGSRDSTATFFYSAETKCIIKSSNDSDTVKREIELIKFGSVAK